MRPQAYRLILTYIVILVIGKDLKLIKSYVTYIITSVTGKDKCDPEMGWLKNVLRSWMLRYMSLMYFSPCVKLECEKNKAN